MTATPEFRVLDCTLRDGGYYTNWDFPWPQVERLLQALASDGVRHFEVGYRAPPTADYRGEFYFCRTSLLLRIRQLLLSSIPADEHSGTVLAIMLNSKEVTPEIVPRLLSGCAGVVDLIRLAVDPDKIPHALTIAKAVAECGFRVAVNLMYLSRNLSDVKAALLQDQLSAAIEDGTISTVNLVDSYGSVLPSEVSAVFRSWRRRFPVGKLCLGFHGHDNLTLAFANALAAVAEGAELIDATVTGMGRGAGNLRTEVALAFCSRSKNPGLVAMTQLEHEFLAMRNKFGWGTSLPYMISGAGDLPQALVMEMMTTGRYHPSTVVSVLHGHQQLDSTCFPTLPDLPGIKKVQETLPGGFLIVGGGPSVLQHATAIVEFAVAKKLIFVHSTTKHLALLCSETQKYGPEPRHLLMLPSQKPLVTLAALDSAVCGFIVAEPPRLPLELPRSYRGRVAQVGPIELGASSHPSTAQFIGGSVASALFDRGSPVGLSLGTVNALAPQLDCIYLCGVDGFTAPSAAEIEISKETELILRRFCEQRQPAFRAVFLTPSSYTQHCSSPHFESRSLYALLSMT